MGTAAYVQDWEEHVKREQKRLKRKVRGPAATAEEEGAAEAEQGGPEGAREDEEFALPPETMRTLHLGEWTPLQLGREPPEARSAPLRAAPPPAMHRPHLYA